MHNVLRVPTSNIKVLKEIVATGFLEHQSRMVKKSQHGISDPKSYTRDVRDVADSIKRYPSRNKTWRKMVILRDGYKMYIGNGAITDVCFTRANSCRETNATEDEHSVINRNLVHGSKGLCTVWNIKYMHQNDTQ